MKSKEERIQESIEALENGKVNPLEVCSRLNLMYMLGGVIEKTSKDLVKILEPAGGFKNKDKFNFNQLRYSAAKIKETTLYQLQSEEAKQDYKNMVDFLSNLCLDALIRVKTADDMLKIESTVKNYFKPKFK